MAKNQLPFPYNKPNSPALTNVVLPKLVGAETRGSLQPCCRLVELFDEMGVGGEKRPPAHTVSFTASRQTWGHYNGKGGGWGREMRGKRPLSNMNRDVFAQANTSLMSLVIHKYSRAEFIGTLVTWLGSGIYL